MKRQASAHVTTRKQRLNLVNDLGFPKIEDIGYFNLKAQSPKYHNQCDKETETKSRAYLEMQRKVDKLEAIKQSQARKIKKL